MQNFIDPSAEVYWRLTEKKPDYVVRKLSKLGATLMMSLAIFLGCMGATTVGANEIHFDSWNLSSEARQEVNRLNQRGGIDLNFQSDNMSDYDFFFAIVDGYDRIAEFPYYDAFKLQEMSLSPDKFAVTEIVYVLTGNDNFKLVLLDGAYFGELSQKCIGRLVFDLMTGVPLGERDGENILGYQSCLTRDG
ncbi:hypothetical protein A9Q94_14665 [Rhodobacterales bacterium 56_14_T64]|nr:hypothetical protein A9Q94_14665 [Rhodobacterales bacterium 56_14_T64]